VALLALFGVIAVGTIGFAAIGAGEHGLVDAIYMTIITLTTVGFGEIIDMSNNPAGRIFTVALLLMGMGIVAYSIPLAAAFVIEGQLFHTFTRRRMEKRIAQLKNHYVVCGDAAAACYVAEEFVRTGRSVVLVIPEEGSPPCPQDALADVPRIAGDPSDDATLLGANIGPAKGVVACMESDKDNLLVVLTARRLAPNTRIVAATDQSDGDAKLRAAGADAVVCASHIGGLRMAAEMVRPKVVSFLDRMLRDTRASLRVEEIAVPPDYAGAGKTLGSMVINEIPGVMLLAVQRAGQSGFEFKPTPDILLEANMTLVVMSDTEGRELLETALKKGIPQ
jgi:voltage-gated potassium channel